MFSQQQINSLCSELMTLLVLKRFSSQAGFAKRMLVFLKAGKLEQISDTTGFK